MRKTIASNRNTRSPKTEPKKIRRGLFIGISLFLVCGLMAYLLKIHFLIFVPLAYFIFLFKTLWHKEGHFHCYIDGQVLYFDFKDTQETGHRQFDQDNNCHLELLLHTIQGYKLHAFLGKAPELMQIQMLVRDKLIETRPIPIYYLNKEQQQTLLDFLDTLIVKTKRLHTG